MCEFSALQIVNWFRVKNYEDKLKDSSIGPITQLKVMKLLYYVQGISLAAYNKLAFNEPIQAWEYGPAISSVHDKYRGFRELPKVKVGKNKDETAFNDFRAIQNSPLLFKIVTAVNKKLGNLTSSQLVKLTHSEYPWRHAEQEHNIYITRESIKDFFKREIVIP